MGSQRFPLSVHGQSLGRRLLPTLVLSAIVSIVYPHFGKYADVWKHLLLCGVLAEHKPSVYVDTNSAYASYELESTPEQMHGIGLFLVRAEGDEALGKSRYFSLQSDAQSCSDRAVYLGSPALALHLLGGDSDKLIFCDFDDAALSSIATYARAIDSKATVVTRQVDSRSTLGEVIPSLRKGAMIFFDPYEAFDPDENGNSFMDRFMESHRAGVSALFWYGFNSLDQRDAARDQVQRAMVGGDRPIHDMWIHLRCIDSSDQIPNPGIFGCGMLCSNISDQALASVLSLTDRLVKLYEGARLYARYDGELISGGSEIVAAWESSSR